MLIETLELEILEQKVFMRAIFLKNTWNILSFNLALGKIFRFDRFSIQNKKFYPFI